VVVALLMSLLGLLDAKPALACACVGFVPFAAAEKGAAIVLAGDVQAVSRPDEHSESRDANESRFVEIRVRRVLKGQVTATHIRVWDAWSGTSCGGAFADLAVGAAVALVLALPETVPIDFRREVWSITGVTPGPGDLVVDGGGCQQSVRQLRTEQDRRHYLGTGRDLNKQPPNRPVKLAARQRCPLAPMGARHGAPQLTGDR
jgi:hypothetical protein